MIHFNRFKNHGRKIYVCSTSDDDIPVRAGLSYSPADMARLQERGMPVNSLNTGTVIIDGEQNPSFEVSSDRSRFVDVCDLWEEHVTIRDKARRAAKISKQNSKSNN